MLAVTVRAGDHGRRRGATSRAGNVLRKHVRRPFAAGLLALAACLCAGHARAEDGYELWLRYHPLPAAAAAAYRNQAGQLIVGKATSTQAATRSELLRGLGGLLGTPPPLSAEVTRDGAIVAGTPSSSALIASLHLDTRDLGSEGYLVRSMRVNGHAATVIAE